jgi:hypothetical protein
MPMRFFDTIVRRLTTHVRACPLPVITQYVRDAAIEVCEDTLAWRYEQPLIRLTPGSFDYPYEPPTQAEVHGFISASLNGRSLVVLTMEQLYDIYPDWPNYDVEQRGQPRYIVHKDPDQFLVAPIPDASEDYDVKMMLALKPLRNASGMDETILDEIENVVMDGALSMLYAIPGKDWSDVRTASYHRQLYSSRKVERRARANLGAGRASVHVRSRPWA